MRQFAVIGCRYVDLAQAIEPIIRRQLDEINAGGLTMDDQVSQLIQAMASYSLKPSFDPTSSSTTVMPQDASLQTALASAWHG